MQSDWSSSCPTTSAEKFTKIYSQTKKIQTSSIFVQENINSEIKVKGLMDNPANFLLRSLA